MSFERIEKGESLTQKSSNNRNSSNKVPEVDDDGLNDKEPTTKNTRDQTATPVIKITSPNRKHKRADSSRTKDSNKGPGRAKVCSLKLGEYSEMFEQKDLGESYTLHLLVNSNAELDPDDGDVWRDTGSRFPTASLSPDRFTEATLYTAWLFLKNGKEPNMSTYSIGQKWSVGERFRRLSELFPDRGQLFAAATLFDIGLALRCPRLQLAAWTWYSEVRSWAWSPQCFAEPSFCKWIVEKVPEETQKTEEYSE